MTKSKSQHTLDMFLSDGDGRPAGWTDNHIDFLRREWAKITPAHKEYNQAYSAVILAKRPTPEVQFIADADIPHLSKWAKVELGER